MSPNSRRRHHFSNPCPHIEPIKISRVRAASIAHSTYSVMHITGSPFNRHARTSRLSSLLYGHIRTRSCTIPSTDLKAVRPCQQSSASSSRRQRSASRCLRLELLNTNPVLTFHAPRLPSTKSSVLSPLYYFFKHGCLVCPWPSRLPSRFKFHT